MKQLVWGTAATALLMSGVATAENNIYLGGQVLQYDIDAQHVNIGNGAKPQGVQLVFGGEVAKYAALELRVGRSTKYDEFAVEQGEDTSAKIDTTFGMYAKAQYPVAPNVKPYVIAGLSKYDFDTSAGGEKESLTDSDISLGFGCSVLPMKNLQVGVEFMRVSDDNANKIGAKVFSTSASVAYIFGN